MMMKMLKFVSCTGGTLNFICLTKKGFFGDYNKKGKCKKVKKK